MEKKSNVISIGTSGFDYDDWRGFFYPADLAKRRFLEHYAMHFRAVELNFSYYRMPTAGQIESMIERTGGEVRFSVKVHRSMTHDRVASEREHAQFEEALAPAREAGVLGAVLAQFPHSFRQTEANRIYLRALADRIGRPLVAEFRRSDWAAAPILDWLSRIGVGYCCVDEPRIKGLMPPAAVATASPGYVRFHGRNAARWYEHDQPHERYDYRYDKRELAEWIPRIREIEKGAGEVLVFFNNHFQAKAVDGAKALGEMLAREAG